MKKYALVALVALAVSVLLDVLTSWYYSDRVIVNPTQQLELFMNGSSIATAVVKFVSVATLLAVGATYLKRSHLQSRIRANGSRRVS